MHRSPSPAVAIDLESVMPPDMHDVPQSSGPEPAFDDADVLALVGGDRGLLRELVNILRAELPGIVRALETALDAADGAGLERWAHKLRGSISTFAANRAASSALRLEAAGRNGDMSAARDELRGLQRALADLMAELSHLQDVAPATN